MDDSKYILLVDDSRFLRMAYEHVLVKAGYQVVAVSDGEEALRLAEERPPDLILLDMLLPKMSGPDVLRRFRRCPETAQVPVIVLSSLPQSNEQKLRAEGATSYCQKSTLDLENSPEALVRIIEQAFRLCRAALSKGAGL
jgi:CheY-like chemotaxis protein